jgi:hypothetical protein
VLRQQQFSLQACESESRHLVGTSLRCRNHAQQAFDDGFAICANSALRFSLSTRSISARSRSLRFCAVFSPTISTITKRSVPKGSTKNQINICSPMFIAARRNVFLNYPSLQAGDRHVTSHALANGLTPRVSGYGGASGSMAARITVSPCRSRSIHRIDSSVSPSLL